MRQQRSNKETATKQEWFYRRGPLTTGLRSVEPYISVPYISESAGLPQVHLKHMWQTRRKKVVLPVTFFSMTGLVAIWWSERYNHRGTLRPLQVTQRHLIGIGMIDRSSDLTHCRGSSLCSGWSHVDFLEDQGLHCLTWSQKTSLVHYVSVHLALPGCISDCPGAQ